MISPTLACLVAMVGCTGATGPAGPAGAGGATGEPGPAGEPGAAGLSTLVRIDEVAPASCPAGGRTIHIGVDDDRDGVLDDTEIDSTLPSCDAREPLVVATRVGPGLDCAVGGLITRVGYDVDDDGVLDDAELTQENAACEPPRPAILAVTLDFDLGFETAAHRFAVDGAALAWSSFAGAPMEVAAAPWGTVLLDVGAGVTELDATTGELLGTFSSSGTVLVDHERLRLYVNDGEGVAVHDLLTREEIGVVDLGVGHAGASMVLADDGSRLIASTFDGGRFHLHDINPATLTRTASQRLGDADRITVMLLVGPTLVIWDDSADQVRVYEGAPLVEDAGSRVTFASDASALPGISAVREPGGNVVYIARSAAPQLVRLQLDLLPATSTFVLPAPARALVMAEDGGRITAHTNDGFIDVLLPSGIVQASPLRRSLITRSMFALHNVQVR